EEIAASEFRLVELRVDVVMVEEEALAGNHLVERADEEDVIGRIARVDGIEAVAPQDLEREHELPEERGGVLQHVPPGAPRLERQGMAVDVNAVQALVSRRVLASRRTDHRHLIATGLERSSFLPHAP